MLKGRSVSLYPVLEKNLDELYRYHLDLTNRGEYFPLNFITEPQFKKAFHETGFWSPELRRLLIFDKQDKLVGSIWAMQTVPYFDAVEIGYIIFDKANYNKGYASESLKLFISYLFDTMSKLNRIELRILHGHAASEQVAKKCGFTFEGSIRGAIFHYGKYQDLMQFSLLRNDPAQ